MKPTRAPVWASPLLPPPQPPIPRGRPTPATSATLRTVRTLLVVLFSVTIPAVTTLNVHENPLDDPLGMPAFDLNLFGKAVTADQVKSVPQDQLLVSPAGITFYCPKVDYDPTSTHPMPDMSDPRTPDQVIADAMRLLKPLAKQPCLSIEQGWWRYDYCHERHVSQIHEFGEKVPPAKYTLGQYAGLPEDKPELHVKAGKRYVSVRYRNGDVCDETGRPRTVEIQYHCSESATSDRLSLVQETALCNYHVTLFSPRLCRDPAMAKPKSSLVHTQSCHLVVDNPESVDIWARNPKAYLSHVKLGVMAADAFLPRSVLVPPVSTHAAAAAAGKGSPLERARARIAAAAPGSDVPGLTPRKFDTERGAGRRMGAAGGAADGGPLKKRVMAGGNGATPAARGGADDVDAEEAGGPALSDMLVEIAESLIRKYKDQGGDGGVKKRVAGRGETAKGRTGGEVGDDEDKVPQLFIVTEDGVVPLDSLQAGRGSRDGKVAGGDEDEQVDGLEPESPLLYGEVQI